MDDNENMPWTERAGIWARGRAVERRASWLVAIALALGLSAASGCRQDSSPYAEVKLVLPEGSPTRGRLTATVAGDVTVSREIEVDLTRPIGVPVNKAVKRFVLTVIVDSGTPTCGILSGEVVVNLTWNGGSFTADATKLTLVCRGPDGKPDGGSPDGVVKTDAAEDAGRDGGAADLVAIDVRAGEPDGGAGRDAEGDVVDGRPDAEADAAKDMASDLTADAGKDLAPARDADADADADAVDASTMSTDGSILDVYCPPGDGMILTEPERLLQVCGKYCDQLRAKCTGILSSPYVDYCAATCSSPFSKPGNDGDTSGDTVSCRLNGLRDPAFETSRCQGLTIGSTDICHN